MADNENPRALADAQGGTDHSEILDSPHNTKIPPRPQPAQFLESVRNDARNDLFKPTVQLNRPAPLETADQFADQFFRADCDATGTRHSRLGLVRSAGQFYAWDGARYVLIPDEDIKAGLYHWLRHAVYFKSGKEQPFNPNVNSVGAVFDALKAVARRPIGVSEPAWLDPNWNPDPRSYVAFQNGRLELRSFMLEPHTPDFFNLSALPFDYDPYFDETPAWDQFLESIWPDDPEAIDCLQEMFGYLVSGSTRLHKMLMIIGPKRSGKGTIGRVLNALLGADNCCGPTLDSLAGPFGLAPLIGKSLAVVSDARFSGKQKAVVERLLMVSGEDAVSVDRKHASAVECKLPTRFLIMSNELPALEDASSALSSRFVLLTMTNSFIGREDHELAGKLMDELPGILNWALRGLRRLNERERFTVPSSSESAMTDLEELGSPISAFVDEYCVIGPDYSVPTMDLFVLWKHWCQEAGRASPGTLAIFGRNLHSAYPGIKKKRSSDGRRPWLYSGLRLIPREI